MILQTHSKIVLLTFLILTPNIMILITLKLIIQTLKNFYIISNKNLETKPKNRYMNQVCNLHETNQLQKYVLKGA